MSMRKMGVIGSFAAGAALALAPLAAAEDTVPATPPDFSHILQGQVQSMNWLFGALAGQAGVDKDLITVGDPTATDPLSFSTISADDLKLPANTDFASLVYGANWLEEMSTGDTGSYNLFNGALTQFNDANNVLMYALMTGGDEIDPTKVDVSDYLFGSDTSIAAALSGDSVWEDFSNFATNGFNDLAGYFAAAVTDATP